MQNIEIQRAVSGFEENFGAKCQIKKMMLLAYLVFFIFMKTLSQTSNAYQANSLTIDRLIPDFTHISPEAASLGRYGTIAMSEYSGVPNIRIPILTVKSGDVSFPMELYYDASGIKVEQEASIVGLGWNVSYGGCISHIVSGHDDFLQAPNKPKSYFEETFNVPNTYTPYYSHYIGNMGMVAHGNDVTICLPGNDPDKFLLYDDLSKGYYSPDIFQGNFCGHNVSFCIDKDKGKIIPLNEETQRYKIDYKISSSHPTSFTIVDEFGITYEFEAFQENGKKDSYFLRYIYGMDGKAGRSSIEIQYIQASCKYRRSTKNYYSYARLNDNKYPSDIGQQLLSLMGENTVYFNLTGSPSGLYNKVYPSKIITKSQTIVFSMQDGIGKDAPKKLCKIESKANDGTILDKVIFSYGIFPENSSKLDAISSRLKLTSVKVNSQNYSMDYESSTLPEPESFSKDFWGYYNGFRNEKLYASPKYKLDGENVVPVEYLGEANRCASETYSKIGVLTKLTYPTGGYSCFEYEPNRFTDKYYYPDANDKFKKSTEEYQARAYGTGGVTQQTKEILVSMSKEYSLCVMLYTPDVRKYTATVSLKNVDTGVIVKNYSTLDSSVGSQFSNTIRLTLKPGRYALEAKVPSCSGSSIPVAEGELSCQTVIVSNPADKDKGGMSLGAGLRIKSIKNYDSSNSKLLGLTLYEYKDGKLLAPTARLETHYVDYSYLGTSDLREQSVNVSFTFIGSDPSYAQVCSIGGLPMVGYSQVIKKKMDGEGKLIKKTILDYYNNGYEMDENISQKINNAFYYNTEGYRNGKLKRETIVSGNNLPLRKREFSYGKSELGYVWFPKCFPTHLPSKYLSVAKYDLAILRMPIEWCYISDIRESSYADGVEKVVTNANYSYNQKNLQISRKIMTNTVGKQTSQTYYWYPADGKSVGASYLLNKHCVGMLTGVDSYRNGILVEGHKYEFTQKTGFPVVSKCCTVLPDGTNIAEATVDVYDEHGNILQYTGKDGTPVTLLWSYNYQCPVMKIVGATYDQMKEYSNYVGTLGSRVSLSKEVLLSIHQAAKSRTLQATAYLYDSRLNVTSIISPNGYEMNFLYDSDGRLMKSSDPFGILQQYEYNYKR